MIIKKKYVLMTLIILLLSVTTTALYNVQNNPPSFNSQDDGSAYHYWFAPENSFGIQQIKTINETYFRQLFNEHFYKNARYKRYSYSEWTDGTQYLTLNKTWNDSGFWKVDIVLDIPVDIYSVNISFGCDLPVLQYVEREGYEIWLNYSANATENYSICFNWSDIASIPELEIYKVRQDNKFWISFKRDNVPAGYYVFDPWFGNKVETDRVDVQNRIAGTKYMSNSTSGYADNITVSFFGADGWFKSKCAIYDSNSQLIPNGMTEERLVWYGEDVFKLVHNFSIKPYIHNDTYYYLVTWGSWIESESFGADYQIDAGGNGVFRENFTYINGSYSDFPSTWNRNDTIDDDGKVFIFCSYTNQSYFSLRNLSSPNIPTNYGNVTWNGEPNDIIWSNETNPGGTMVINLSVNASDNITDIRVWCDDLDVTVNASNISLYVSSDNSSFGLQGTFADGGSNITINSSTWPVGAGTDPFPINNLSGWQNTSIYCRFLVAIPLTTIDGTYYQPDWKVYIGRYE